MLKYILRENNLTADPDDYFAQETDARIYSQDDIAEEMLKRGSSLTRADIAAYQKLEAEVYASIIEQGGHISTPLISTNLSIGGVFHTPADSFDKLRHTIKLNINAGSVLREAISKIKVQKMDRPSTDPLITNVIDKVTGDSSEIKLGSVIDVMGSRLKFDASDPEQGVFVITSAGELRCDGVVGNSPSHLLVMLPKEMPMGEFTVEVRTRLINATGKSVKNLKKGSFAKTLIAIG